MPDITQDKTGTGIEESSGDRDGSTSLRRLGDFELLRQIGRGGMGVVYEARQISLKRRVALKVLPPALGMSPQAKQRFEREAQAAAKLHHTNIVPVHAIGEHDGHHFYAMDLIDGQSLDLVMHEMVDAGSNSLMDLTVTQTATELRPRQAARPAPDQATTSLSDGSAAGREWFDTVAKLLAEVADALHYAHGRGVIHRDVKPANLMLSREGHLSITDFGLARLLDEPGMTVSGSFLGTPAYMAPEQIAAGRIRVDHRADVYALGAVLYEMLTLQRPFGGQSREQLLAEVMTKDPRPPRRLNGRIPVDLETICLKALEKDVDRRYSSAGEMARDLRHYLQGGLISARRAGIARRTWKSIRRHPTAALAVIAVLIVVAASMFAWQWGRRGKEAERLVADARLALREGTYRDGLQLIDRAVALDPGSVGARLVRARLLSTNFRFHEAADEAHLVLSKDPQNWKAHAILAGLARYPGDHGIASIDPGPHLKVVEASAPDSGEATCLRALLTKDARRRMELLGRALDTNPGDALALVAKLTTLGSLKDHVLALSEADRLITARPKSAQGWRFKALSYRLLQDFDNAQTAIERAMDTDDRDPWNYVERSRILWDIGGSDEALADLARAIELAPLADYYGERAAKLNALGRFEEAIADAQKCTELNPDDRVGYEQLLWSYLSLEREDDARATIDGLETHADRWFDIEARAWAHRTAAHYYRQLKDYDRAMDSVERAIRIDPADFRAFIERMKIHKESGDDAGAEADCRAAARIELGDPEDLLNRGRRLTFDCNAGPRAIEDFDRVIELAPRWHQGYLQRGTAYAMLKRYDEARADMDRSIELAPLFASSYNNRSQLLEDRGLFEEALVDMQRALELNPHYALGWTNYGLGLMRLGRVDEALAAHEKAIKLDPRRGSAIANFADTLAWLGRCDEATDQLRRAEEVSPLSPVNHYNIAHAHLWALYYNCPEQSDPDEAMRHARFAYEAQPARLGEILAMALFRKDNFAEARRIARKLLDQDSDSSLQYLGYTLAMCLWRLGEEQEARELYDRSATWNERNLPDSPLLIRQREETAELLGIER